MMYFAEEGSVINGIVDGGRSKIDKDKYGSRDEQFLPIFIKFIFTHLICAGISSIKDGLSGQDKQARKLLVLLRLGTKTGHGLFLKQLKRGNEYG